MCYRTLPGLSGALGGKPPAHGRGVYDPLADRELQPKPITAVYHADSGGYTAASAEVWGNTVPYLIARPDPFAVSPNSSWSRTLAPEAVARGLAGLGMQVGLVQAVTPLLVSESGRPCACASWEAAVAWSWMRRNPPVCCGVWGCHPPVCALRVGRCLDRAAATGWV